MPASSAVLRPWACVLRALLILCVALPALGQPARQPAAGGVPPIIDRELFFGNPEISGATLSPDGRYIALLKPYKDTRNVWVKKTEDPFDKAKLVTADTKRPIQGFFWSRDSRYILFVQDQGGDENFNVYAVNPVTPPPEARRCRRRATSPTRKGRARSSTRCRRTIMTRFLSG